VRPPSTVYRISRGRVRVPAAWINCWAHAYIPDLPYTYPDRYAQSVCRCIYSLCYLGASMDGNLNKYCALCPWIRTTLALVVLCDRPIWDPLNICTVIVSRVGWLPLDPSVSCPVCPVCPMARMCTAKGNFDVTSMLEQLQKGRNVWQYGWQYG
jgi:hypothetical protein